MGIPKVVLSVVMDTLSSLNQTCAASAQGIVSISQSEGSNATCEEEARAVISGLNVDQQVTSDADCVMAAGSAQRQELMSEALRERYAAGIAGFIAKNSGDDKTVTAINEISDRLSSSAFSECYSKANIELTLAQANACTNIIENVDINQTSEAIVEKCLLVDGSASSSEALLSLVAGDEDEAEDLCKPLGEFAYTLLLVFLALIVVGFVLVFAVSFIKSLGSGEEEPAAPAATPGTESSATPGTESFGA